MQRAGETPMDAIVSATSMSAESLGMGKSIGTIAAGLEADIVAVEGNPLEDITARPPRRLRHERRASVPEARPSVEVE